MSKNIHSVQNWGLIWSPPSSFTPPFWILGQEPGQWGEPQRAYHHCHHPHSTCQQLRSSERQSLVRISQLAGGRAGTDPPGVWCGVWSPYLPHCLSLLGPLSPPTVPVGSCSLWDPLPLACLAPYPSGPCSSEEGEHRTELLSCLPCTMSHGTH